MPDKSEVIMEQMDHTRKELADKIETLEKKVAGTVETVTETVQTVEHTVENVKDTIAETVETVTGTVKNTVDAVGETVGNTVERVKGFFDVPRHVDRHPWLAMGGSVLVGFLGGRLLTPRSNRARATPARAAPPASTPPSPPRQESAAREAKPQAREGLLHNLGEQFGDEVEKLKGLAVGTLFGVARDMISQALPEVLKQQVKDVINGFTDKLGGKVIREPLLAEQHQEEAPSGKEDKAGAGSGRR
jgi:ElaB/YqjD/DUF883 family membrane-anchored ribosome-binding protein